MDKIKLAVCIKDEEYETRFVKCIMNHYKESYEIHIVEDMADILEEQKKKFHVVVTGDDETFNFGDWKETVRLVLQEDEMQHENRKEEISEGVLEEAIFYTAKYQEVYKIMEILEQALLQQSAQKICRAGSSGIQLIGVFSLEQEGMQMPFTALLAEILGDKNRVLVIDLQPFSGLSVELETSECALGMEDLMTVAMTEVYTSNRLTASIGHEQKWDYVYPVKNVQCLSETSGEIYEKIIEMLQKERGYECVILNFGAVFSGVIDLMNACQQFYMLTERKEEYSWREEAFVQEMRGQKREEFLRNIIWMEIPVCFVRGKTWRKLTKDWLWSELGDKLREINWLEMEDGTYM